MLQFLVHINMTVIHPSCDNFFGFCSQVFSNVFNLPGLSLKISYNQRKMAKKGNVPFTTFAYNFFTYEVQGTGFCMGMSYHFRQLVVRKSCHKKGLIF